MGRQSRNIHEVTNGSLAAGTALADYFARDGRPEPIAPRFRMRPGEETFAVGEGAVWQYLEGDGSYMKNSFFSLNPVQLAIGATAAAIGNASRRAAAARNAAAAWRQVEYGEITLTNQRIAINGGEWTDIWHEDINLAECDGISVQVNSSGSAPLRLEVPSAHWWWVMLHKVAWSQHVRPDGAPVER